MMSRDQKNFWISNLYENIYSSKYLLSLYHHQNQLGSIDLFHQSGFYQYLVLKFENISTVSKNLHNTQYSPFLRFSLWKDSSTKFSEDVTLASNEKKNKVFLFPVNIQSLHDETLEYFLYIDVVDPVSNIPIATGTKKITISKTPSTSALLQTANDSNDISVQLFLNDNISKVEECFVGLQKSVLANLSIKLCTISLFQKITQPILTNLSAHSTTHNPNNNHNSYEYHLIAPLPTRWKDVFDQVYLRGHTAAINNNRGYLLVEDVNLNKDILDLYANRHILVRFYSKRFQNGKEIIKSIFLGSICQYDGNWLECCEIELDSNENYFIDISIGEYRKDRKNITNSSKSSLSNSKYSSFEDRKKNEELSSSSMKLFEFYPICSGEFSPSTILTTGKYSIDLFTQLQTNNFQLMMANNTTATPSMTTRVKVGLLTLSVKIFSFQPNFTAQIVETVDSPTKKSIGEKPSLSPRQPSTPAKLSDFKSSVTNTQERSIFDDIEKGLNELFSDPFQSSQHHHTSSSSFSSRNDKKYMNINHSKKAQEKAIVLLGLLCSEIVRLPYHPDNLSKALKYYLYQLEKLLFYFISLSNQIIECDDEDDDYHHDNRSENDYEEIKLDEEDDDNDEANGKKNFMKRIPMEEILWYFFNNPNLIFPLIYTFNIYFQEWLVSDIAQELLSLKQNSFKKLLEKRILKQYSSSSYECWKQFLENELFLPIHNYSMINYLVILKKLLFIFTLLKEFLIAINTTNTTSSASFCTKQYYQSLLILQKSSIQQQLAKIEIFSFDYLMEISEDFLLIFIHYRSFFMNIFHSFFKVSNNELPQSEVALSSYNSSSSSSSSIPITEELFQEYLSIFFELNGGIHGFYDLFFILQQENQRLKEDSIPMNNHESGQQGEDNDDDEILNNHQNNNNHMNSSSLSIRTILKAQKDDDFQEKFLEWSNHMICILSQQRIQQEQELEQAKLDQANVSPGNNWIDPFSLSLHSFFTEKNAKFLLSLWKQLLIEKCSLLTFHHGSSSSSLPSSKNQAESEDFFNSSIQQIIYLMEFLKFSLSSYFLDNLEKDYYLYYWKEMKLFFHSIFLTIHYTIIEKKFYPISLKLHSIYLNSFQSFLAKKSLTTAANNNNNNTPSKRMNVTMAMNNKQQVQEFNEYYQNLILLELSEIIRYYHRDYLADGDDEDDDEEEHRDGNGPMTNFHFFIADQSSFNHSLLPNAHDKRHSLTSAGHYFNYQDITQNNQFLLNSVQSNNTSSNHANANNNRNSRNLNRRSINEQQLLQQQQQQQQPQSEENHCLQFFQDFSSIFHLLFFLYDSNLALEEEIQSFTSSSSQASDIKEPAEKEKEKDPSEFQLINSQEILLLKLIFHFFWTEKLIIHLTNNLDSYTFMKRLYYTYLTIPKKPTTTMMMATNQSSSSSSYLSPNSKLLVHARYHHQQQQQQKRQDLTNNNHNNNNSFLGGFHGNHQFLLLSPQKQQIILSINNYLQHLLEIEDRFFHYFNMNNFQADSSSSPSFQQQKLNPKKTILNEFTILFLEFFATFNGTSFLLYEENILTLEEENHGDILADDDNDDDVKNADISYIVRNVDEIKILGKDDSDEESDEDDGRRRHRHRRGLLNDLDGEEEDEEDFLLDEQNIFSKKTFKLKLFHLSNSVLEMLFQVIRLYYNQSMMTMASASSPPPSTDGNKKENGLDSQLENEMNQIAYLLEIFLFHIREIVGIHFITNMMISLQQQSQQSPPTASSFIDPSSGKKKDPKKKNKNHQKKQNKNNNKGGKNLDESFQSAGGGGGYFMKKEMLKKVLFYLQNGRNVTDNYRWQQKNKRNLSSSIPHEYLMENIQFLWNILWKLALEIQLIQEKDKQWKSSSASINNNSQGQQDSSSSSSSFTSNKLLINILKLFQQEILSIFFELISNQSLHSLFVHPDENGTDNNYHYHLPLNAEEENLFQLTATIIQEQQQATTSYLQHFFTQFLLSFHSFPSSNDQQGSSSTTTAAEEIEKKQMENKQKESLFHLFQDCLFYLSNNLLIYETTKNMTMVSFHHNLSLFCLSSTILGTTIPAIPSLPPAASTGKSNPPPPPSSSKSTPAVAPVSGMTLFALRNPEKAAEMKDIFQFHELTSQLLSIFDGKSFAPPKVSSSSTYPWEFLQIQDYQIYEQLMQQIDLAIDHFSKKIQDNSLKYKIQKEEENKVGNKQPQPQHQGKGNGEEKQEEHYYFLKYSQKNFVGILSFLKFFFSLYFHASSHRFIDSSSASSSLLLSPTTGTATSYLSTFYQNEKEIKYLRETLQYLLSSGQWELGLELSNFILHLLSLDDGSSTPSSHYTFNFISEQFKNQKSNISSSSNNHLNGNNPSNRSFENNNNTNQAAMALTPLTKNKSFFLGKRTMSSHHLLKEESANSNVVGPFSPRGAAPSAATTVPGSTNRPGLKRVNSVESDAMFLFSPAPLQRKNSTASVFFADQANSPLGGNLSLSPMKNNNNSNNNSVITTNSANQTINPAHFPTKLSPLRSIAKVAMMTHSWQKSVHQQQQQQQQQAGNLIPSTPKTPSSTSIAPATSFISTTGGGAGGGISAAATSSPAKKRKETFKNEMSRIINKFKDKLKFDGLLRLPKQYIAIRLLSTSPILLPSLLSSTTTTSSSSSFSSSAASSFFENLEILNLTNLKQSQYQLSPHSSSSPLIHEETGMLNVNNQWYEEWLLLSFDMLSYGTAAEFYSYDYLEVHQYSSSSSSSSDKNSSNNPEEVSSLISPLSFPRIIQELAKYFPGFQYLSPMQRIEQLINLQQLHSSLARMTTGLGMNPSPLSASVDLQYFQCFPAFPKESTERMDDEIFEDIHSNDDAHPEEKSHADEHNHDDDENDGNDDDQDDEDHEKKSNGNDDDDDGEGDDGDDDDSVAKMTKHRKQTKNLQKKLFYGHLKEFRERNPLTLSIKENLDEIFMKNVFESTGKEFFIYSHYSAPTNTDPSSSTSSSNAIHSVMRFTLFISSQSIAMNQLVSSLVTMTKPSKKKQPPQSQPPQGKVINNALSPSKLNLLSPGKQQSMNNPTANKANAPPPPVSSPSSSSPEFQFPSIISTMINPITLMKATHLSSMPYLQSSYEVLLAYLLPLQRCQRILTHINDLTMTELNNQPEKTLLHSNKLFFYIFDLLTKLLSIPNQHVIGLSNITILIIHEKEKFENEWQRIRKIMKREYMRSIQSYEEQFHAYEAYKTGKIIPSSSSHEPGGKGLKQPKRPIKPSEPDLEAARKEYEESNQLSYIYKVELLCDYEWKLIDRILLEMRKFVNTLGQSKKPNTFSDQDAREIVQKEGRISSMALKKIREQRQLERLSIVGGSPLLSGDRGESPGSAMFTEEEVILDDDYRVKLKMLLFLESLYASLELGVTLR